MPPGIGTIGISLLAGMLSTLSPCVLPIVPIILGSAASVHPRAPLVLAAGLALSYALVGTLLAWAGAALDLDVTLFREAGAVLLGLLGLLLVSSALQQLFATLTAGAGNAGNSLLARIRGDGLTGQFIIGLVLGVVWSPCVGPTLGAAIVLASQGRDLVQAALVMLAFGAGAALPLVLLAMCSRQAMGRVKHRLQLAGQAGKQGLGLIMIGLSMLILTGADKHVETWLVAHSPAALTRITTAF